MVYISNEWLRRILCIVGITLCCWNLHPRLEGSELVGDDQYGGVFQTSDNDITLLPKRLYGVDDLSNVIQSHLPPLECHLEQIVLMEKNAMADEVAIRVSQTNPCTAFKRQLQRIGPKAKERTIPVWIRDPNQTDVTESWMLEQDFIFREEVLMDNRFRLQVWVKRQEERTQIDIFVTPWLYLDERIQSAYISIRNPMLDCICSGECHVRCLHQHNRKCHGDCTSDSRLFGTHCTDSKGCLWRRCWRSKKD